MALFTEKQLGSYSFGDKAGGEFTWCAGVSWCGDQSWCGVNSFTFLDKENV